VGIVLENIIISFGIHATSHAYIIDL